ncbi:hypothetical protein D3C81_1535570 [compost metagenome]
MAALRDHARRHARRGKRLAQLAGQRELVGQQHQRRLAQRLEPYCLAARPGYAARAHHPDRIARELARGKVQPAVAGQQRGTYLKFTIRHLLLDHLPAMLGQGQFQIGIALTERADGRREEQVDHRRQAHGQLPAPE